MSEQKKAKQRVYELAKELSVDNKEILGIAKKLNITVKSHLSTITEEQAKQIKEALATEGYGEESPTNTKDEVESETKTEDSTEETITETIDKSVEENVDENSDDENVDDILNDMLNLGDELYTKPDEPVTELSQEDSLPLEEDEIALEDLMNEDVVTPVEEPVELNELQDALDQLGKQIVDNYEEKEGEIPITDEEGNDPLTLGESGDDVLPSGSLTPNQDTEDTDSTITESESGSTVSEDNPELITEESDTELSEEESTDEIIKDDSDTELSEDSSELVKEASDTELSEDSPELVKEESDTEVSEDDSELIKEESDTELIKDDPELVKEESANELINDDSELVKEESDTDLSEDSSELIKEESEPIKEESDTELSEDDPEPIKEDLTDEDDNGSITVQDNHDTDLDADAFNGTEHSMVSSGVKIGDIMDGIDKGYTSGLLDDTHDYKPTLELGAEEEIKTAFNKKRQHVEDSDLGDTEDALVDDTEVLNENPLDEDHLPSKNTREGQQVQSRVYRFIDSIKGILPQRKIKTKETQTPVKVAPAPVDKRVKRSKKGKKQVGGSVKTRNQQGPQRQTRPRQTAQTGRYTPHNNQRQLRSNPTVTHTNAGTPRKTQTRAALERKNNKNKLILRVVLGLVVSMLLVVGSTQIAGFLFNRNVDYGTIAESTTVSAISDASFGKRYMKKLNELPTTMLEQEFIEEQNTYINLFSNYLATGENREALDAATVRYFSIIELVADKAQSKYQSNKSAGDVSSLISAYQTNVDNIQRVTQGNIKRYMTHILTGYDSKESLLNLHDLTDESMIVDTIGSISNELFYVHYNYLTNTIHTNTIFQ